MIETAKTEGETNNFHEYTIEALVSYTGKHFKSTLEEPEEMPEANFHKLDYYSEQFNKRRNIKLNERLYDLLEAEL